MILNFTKYQGAGNDFILVDNRQKLYDKLDVAALCHPKFGIGADGLMLLQNTPGFDFEMVYYNSDGNTSTMCGNGGRCIVDFAKSLNIFFDVTTRFKAIDGGHEAKWSPEKVELKMSDVRNIEADGKNLILNTGSPHYVVFVDDVSKVDIVNEARKIRYNKRFAQEGINVNFVQVTDNSNIIVRTYERGVENETLSCGTGVTASAIALSEKHNFLYGEFRVNISTPGGNLEVKYHISGHHEFSDVWLIGPAVKVFKGTITI